MIWQALAHFFGLDNGSGPIYLAWSGAGGDIGELSLIGLVVGLAMKHNCHTKGCWRMGRRKLLDGTEEVVCHKHHPVPQRTHAQILADHAAANPNG